jgi:hypothetical protein
MLLNMSFGRARLFSILLAAMAPLAHGELAFPAASPAATVQQQIGLTQFEITYSRPSVKGREIFGSLQSWDQVWRTGANAATKLSFDSQITFGGRAVAAGTYALFTIPGPDSWVVILNRVADQWGASRYDADQDVVRVEVPSRQTDTLVETLRIGFDALRDESADLVIAWEHAHIRVPIEVDVRGRLQPAIEAAMSTGAKQPDYIYFQAAAFYFDHEIDVAKAATWVDLALDQNPRAFWMLHLKAKIHAKLGNTAIAIAAAEASTEQAVAQEGPSSGYKVMNDALIASLR